MQSIQWYVNRLRTMSGSEIAWRVQSLLAALTEHARVSMNLIAKPVYVADFSPEQAFSPPFRVTPIEVGCWQDDSASLWKRQLVAKADLICEHKLSFFNLKEKHLGDPINWNHDHGSDIPAPLKPILKVDYRDCARFGDCKLVWEPNRHHHLVVLGRAYRATGDMKYAREVVAQIESWLDQNPYGYGMNWRSPLELGIRLINWVWAIDLIFESGLFTGSFQKRLLESVYLHCRDVSGKYSQGSSANNHLVGEAAGVFVAASYFNIFKKSTEWAYDAKSILDREIFAQTFPDGCTKEHALGYQFFVFQFYWISGLVGKWHNDSFSGAYWAQLELLTLFVAQLSEAGGQLPMFGDRDDGYVLDLGDAGDDMQAFIDLACQLFDNDYLKELWHGPSETVYWLMGDARKNPESATGEVNLASRAYTNAGYFLMQSGSSLDDCVSLLVDVAELGYTAIAAHGHADALAFTMRLNGQDLLVDSGTFDYFTYPAWRNYFRTTKAHNTVEIDGLDQSVMTGPFMWEKHANAKVIAWEPSEEGGRLVASHDGYHRLEDPVTHSRELKLDHSRKRLVVRDTLDCSKQHTAALHYHLSEFVKDLQQTGNRIDLVLANDTSVTFEFDASLEVHTITGSASDPETPGRGWLSRGYHQKTPNTCIVASAAISGNTTLET
ncbi:MAG: alginate lyase family protein, partial [Ketobacteraceae bacterium]|nr:alginate lyase family protein [Ketobacteraceae bacterium]